MGVEEDVEGGVEDHVEEGVEEGADDRWFRSSFDQLKVGKRYYCLVKPVCDFIFWGKFVFVYII